MTEINLIEGAWGYPGKSNSWIKNTGDSCPEHPDTVVEVATNDYLGKRGPGKAKYMPWNIVTEYRIIAPVEQKTPDLINLRLECLKLAVTPEVSQVFELEPFEQTADRFLKYVLNGLADTK